MLLALSPWVAACSYDWDGPLQGLDASMNDAPTDATNEPPNEGAPPPDRLPPPDGPDLTCGPQKPCGKTFYCSYDDKLCGTGIPMGTCVPWSSMCPAGDHPYCSCSGMTLSSDCMVFQTGEDLNATGGCMPPPMPPAFPCGYTACYADKEICVATVKSPVSFRCIPDMTMCMHDCGCLIMTFGPKLCPMPAMPIDCKAVVDGGVRVDCP